ncbi:O-antigen ligase family protein [Arthrobacter sp. G.S.26]|uniref:O-antigen ligase family protein n=1 Tax=Arthrobacter sp. G.S.26 TaxID=3433706 RepID=UPI003D787FA4
MIASGVGVVHSPSATVAMIFGTLVVIGLSLRPTAAVYLTILLAATTLPEVVPTTFRLAGFSFRAYEPFLVVSAIYVLVRYKSSRSANIKVCFLVFLFLAWSILGLSFGNPPLKIVADVRLPIYMAIAYAIGLRIAGTDLSHRVLSTFRISLWFSAGITLLSSTTGLPINGREADSTLNLQGTGDEAIRLLSAATYPSLAVLCSVIALAIAGRASLWSTISFGAPALFIVVVSFSRNSILGIGVAAIYAIIAARKTRAMTRALSIASGILTAAIAVVIAEPLLRATSGGSWLVQQIEAFQGRVLGGLTTDGLATDGSAQFRFEQEDFYLLPKIWDSPLIGHGFGYAYKPLFTGRIVASDDFQYYAHNFYLWLLVKTGIIGLAIFVFALVLPLFHAQRHLGAQSLATGAAAVGLLACSFVAPMPLGSPTSVLLGVLAGICAAAAPGVSTRAPEMISPTLEVDVEWRNKRLPLHAHTTRQGDH